MSKKYWSLVMWGFGASPDGGVAYKPSIAHNCRAYDTWEEAMLTGHNAISSRGRGEDRAYSVAMPVFIATVVHQETKPDTTTLSPLRLFVNRISLDNDDML